MKKENLFIGVKFNNNKTLYEKVVKHKMNNSDLIRQSLEEHFQNTKLNKNDNNNNNEIIIKAIQQQYNDHVKDLQKELDYFQHRLDYFMTIKTPIINRLFMKNLLEYKPTNNKE